MDEKPAWGEEKGRGGGETEAGSSGMDRFLDKHRSRSRSVTRAALSSSRPKKMMPTDTEQWAPDPTTHTLSPSSAAGTRPDIDNAEIAAAVTLLLQPMLKYKYKKRRRGIGEDICCPLLCMLPPVFNAT